MNKSNDIDLKYCFKRLYAEKSSIYHSILLSLLISIVYIFISTPLYKSYITLYPAGELSDSDTIMNNFSGIAETFGFSDFKVPSSYYIPDIVNSYSLKRDLVLRNWNISGYDTPINLLDYWDINKNDIGLITKVKNIFFTLNHKVNINEINIHRGVKKLNYRINVEDQLSGLIKVNIYMEDPYLASDMANFISEYVVKFVENEQKHQADLNKEFLDTRVNSASLDLSESEEKYTKFLKDNPTSVETPEILQQKERLIRNILVNQQLYITLREQLEIAKLEALKSRLFINKLDLAYPSFSISKPNKIIVFLLMFILGVFFSSVHVLFRKRIKNNI